jgi:hypothetical protein
MLINQIIIFCVNSNYMHKRNKVILGFSIVYWISVAIGIALFSVAFDTVPVGYYALKANYFSPNI